MAVQKWRKFSGFVIYSYSKDVTCRATIKKTSTLNKTFGNNSINFPSILHEREMNFLSTKQPNYLYLLVE